MLTAQSPWIIKASWCLEELLLYPIQQNKRTLANWLLAAWTWVCLKRTVCCLWHFVRAVQDDQGREGVYMACQVSQSVCAAVTEGCWLSRSLITIISGLETGEPTGKAQKALGLKGSLLAPQEIPSAMSSSGQGANKLPF